jgi:hypothetical protein
MMKHYRMRIEQRLNHWIARQVQRLGRVSRYQHVKMVLNYRHLYVLPTATGWVMCVLLMLMLGASLNYQLNIGFVFTFWLASVALISVFVTHRQLHGIELECLDAIPQAVGGVAVIRCKLSAQAQVIRHDLTVMLYNPLVADVDCNYRSPPHRVTQAVVLNTASDVIELVLPIGQAGVFVMPRMRWQSRYPFGLWRVWGWWQPPMSLIAWPAPNNVPYQAVHTDSDDVDEQPQDAIAKLSQSQVVVQGEGDLAGITLMQAGDSMQRIAWKLWGKQPEHGALSHIPLKLLQNEAQLHDLTPWLMDVMQRPLRYQSATPMEWVAIVMGWIMQADQEGRVWQLNYVDQAQQRQRHLQTGVLLPMQQRQLFNALTEWAVRHDAE